MKGMILAAGLGTRLKPLTDTIPKALVGMGDHTMLELSLKYLKKFGIHDVIINLHHFPEQIKKYIDSHDGFGMNISYSDESDRLLDTGGAVKHASWFLCGNNPFVLMAVDVLTDLDLFKMMEIHQKVKALTTLAVKSRTTSRYLHFNPAMELVGWSNNQTGEKKGERINESSCSLGFSGIQILDPRIFDLITESGAFSIIDLYLRLSSSQKIIGFSHDNTSWIEFGRYEMIRNILQDKQYNELISTLL